MDALVEEVRAELHLLVPLVDPSGLPQAVRQQYRDRIHDAEEISTLRGIASELISVADGAALIALERGEPVCFERSCLAAKELHIILVALARLTF